MALKLRTERLVIAGHSLEFELPAEPEQMLEQALSGEEAGESGWDPYWGLLWAAAPKTAELLLRQTWPPTLNSLELGCGVGLTGIAGLKAGLRVTFADHSQQAVTLAKLNAARNGFPDAEGLVFSWQSPPDCKFDFIFASDVLYDKAGHEPLLHSLSRLLTNRGLVWIGDAGRANAPLFVRKATAAGWQVELLDETGQCLDAPEHLQFRLITLTRTDSRQ